jgi:hypothetical protein
MPTTINTLPDEMLLDISKKIIGKHRNTYLANLSLVSRRFAPIAQEALICAPRFCITQIHKYLWALGNHSTWIPKIRSLEMHSKSNEHRFIYSTVNRNFAVGIEGVRAPAEFWSRNAEFKNACLKMIRFYTDDQAHDVRWRLALETDMPSALLGILLVSLPNLKELKIAASWLVDFPLFVTLVTDNVRRTPSNWRPVYLSSVLRGLQGKLEVLELPTDLSHTMDRVVYDFRDFQNLTQLSLPMGLLDFTRAQPPQITLLPRTLQILRITEATHTTANVVNTLCLAFKKSRFPSLSRIEVYFTHNWPTVQEQAERHRSLDPYWDMRRICADAGLALFLYFSGTQMQTRDVGRSLWASREDGEIDFAEAVHHERRRGCFGLFEPRCLAFVEEIDAQGDVVMN